MAKKILYALVLCILVPLYAKAETWQKLDVASRYDMYWGGVKVGYMAAEIRQNQKGRYRFEVRIKSKGLLEWVSQYESTTVATFRFVKDDLMPMSFYSKGSLRGKYRTTLLKYNKKGTIIKEEITPPKKPWKNKDVDESLLVSAQNPLTGAVMVREIMKRFIEKKYDKVSFNIAIYDGKRLGDYRFSVLGNQAMFLKGSNVNTFAMNFSREPIAGFSDNEIEKLKEEPVISVYFLKDQALLPVKAEAKIPFGGSAVVLFDRNCTSIEDCVR